MRELLTSVMDDKNKEEMLNIEADDGETDKKIIWKPKPTIYSILGNWKKIAKCRLNKARSQIYVMLKGHQSSKTEIRLAVKKVIVERDIVEKLIQALKEAVT